MNVKVKRLHPDAVLPQYATNGAAGFDLVAVEDVIIEPGQAKLIPTGLAFEIPEGFEMQIRMRSGIAKRTPLRLPNSIGTIDADYRGEVFMMFGNTASPSEQHGDTLFAHMIEGTHGNGITAGGFVVIDGYSDNAHDPSYIIRKGDRVAQAVIAPVMHANFEEVNELSDTERGGGGFGSTGV
ncbi:dUTP diphosphatase [Melghirimyces algeriensis]|uniref:dUTP diphosphatase n=1 Tax=Melghirimyces algeriensis TaxID=910412 RepID=UPI001FE9B75C|nr:dUTP diphosphatase [Melghirimyces algeriensis]